jgi:hypothetical protein
MFYPFYQSEPPGFAGGSSILDVIYTLQKGVGFLQLSIDTPCMFIKYVQRSITTGSKVKQLIQLRLHSSKDEFSGSRVALGKGGKGLRDLYPDWSYR